MRLCKAIIPASLLCLLFILTNCSQKGESLIFHIQLESDLRRDEVNLLHLEWVPAEWAGEDGWVFRTCPGDRINNQDVGHHYLTFSNWDEDEIYQFLVYPEENERYQKGKASLKSQEIFLGESDLAYLFHVEAWHYDNIEGRQQGSFGERFQNLNSLSYRKELLYSNNFVVIVPEHLNKLFYIELLPAHRTWASPSGLSWYDNDEDLFGTQANIQDCLDSDINQEVFGTTRLLSLGCEIHPYAAPHECGLEGPEGCNCAGISLYPTITSTATITPTSTSTPTITPTQPTSTPSLTPSPTPTPTLPNTPTLTSTPNYRPVARATFSAPAQCPAAGDPELPDLSGLRSYDAEVLDEIKVFLSAGGSVTELRRELESVVGRDGVVLQDMTRDGVNEVILLRPFLEVLGCQEGGYQQLLRIYPGEPTRPAMKVTIIDLNGNALPEFVIEIQYWGVNDYTLEVRVFEWDGVDFVNRMAKQINHPYFNIGRLYWDPGRALMFNGDLFLRDVDHNGTIELVLSGGVEGGMVSMVSAPQLPEEHTWMWNGFEYTLVDVRFSEPTIKFHAAWLGDLYSLMGEYDRAIAYYQQATFDSELIAWNKLWNEWGIISGNYDPSATKPPQDYDQGHRVSTYARYRMLLVHYLLGNDFAIQTQTDKLEEIGALAYPGYRYVELAAVFQEAYLETGSITQGCLAAQRCADGYADEILWPLGASVYGEVWWGYDAEDICPFTDANRP
jgi:tetratricopeptide (TPR) repeat protein